MDEAERPTHVNRSERSILCSENIVSHLETRSPPLFNPLLSIKCLKFRENDFAWGEFILWSIHLHNDWESPCALEIDDRPFHVQCARCIYQNKGNTEPSSQWVCERERNAESEPNLTLPGVRALNKTCCANKNVFRITNDWFRFN